MALIVLLSTTITVCLAADCRYHINLNYGYSCELSDATFLENDVNFDINESDHLSGYNDSNIKAVYSPAHSSSLLIEKIPQELFIKFENLKYLSLINVGLLSINRGDLVNCKLQNLWLENNNITALASGAFEGCPTIKTLILDGNDINHIDASTFQVLKNLVTISLRDNPLITIDEATFHGLEHLTSLNLRATQLQGLQHHFRELPALATLSLGFNNITTLESDTFEDLPSLKYLYLEQCNIQEIEPLAFGSLERLHQLNLRGNNIMWLNSNFFATTLHELNILEIDLCNIRMVQRSFFSHFPNLHVLLATENDCIDTDFGFESGIDEQAINKFEQCFWRWEGSPATPGSASALFKFYNISFILILVIFILQQ